MLGNLVAKRGILLAPGGRDHGAPFIATIDAAHMMADVVGKQTSRNRTFEAGGPEYLTWGEVAELLSKKAGRRVRVKTLPAWYAWLGQWMMVPIWPSAANVLALVKLVASHRRAGPVAFAFYPDRNHPPDRGTGLCRSLAGEHPVFTFGSMDRGLCWVGLPCVVRCADGHGMKNARSYPTKVKAGFEATGKSIGELTVEDLAPIDHFHFPSLGASKDLVEEIGINDGGRVLDIGCGAGGFAHVLASRTGCHITSVYLDDVCVAAGDVMPQWSGLKGKLELDDGSATALSFKDAAFDVAWIVHAGTFVPDKARFYGEVLRVLKPGMRLSIIDTFRAVEGDHSFPVL